MANGNLRNKPCPCGSGKKFKHCCMNKKPRTTAITMDMGKPVAVNGVRVSPDGSVELLRDGVPLIPEKAYHDVSYSRGKGPKILNRMPIDPARLVVNQYRHFKDFNLLYAIDTNTRNVNSEKISISCVVLCKITAVEEDHMTAEYAPIHCLEFRNIKQFAENIAWMKAIQFVISHPLYGPNLKIGFIVDSDLGKLSAYNSRSLPIYGDFYLPQNVELIYASADVGKEFLENQLISVCDKEAEMLLEAVSKGKFSDGNLQEMKNEPYTHFRFWNKK
jgi:hypothetical protein